MKEFFTTLTHSNGESFTVLRHKAPEWLKLAVNKAHCGDPTNVWIYAECQAACEAIVDGGLIDDESVFDYTDRRVDVDTSDIYQWAADMCLTHTYTEAENDEISATGPADQIGLIQFRAIERIAQTMLNAYLEQ